MTRTVKKPEQRRQEIIKATRFLFSTRDYDKTTMQDVIDHLGIAKGTIYYYFKSKEELLEAVVHDIIDDSLTHMQSVLAQTSGNALEKIRQLVLAGSVSEDNEDILDQLHRPANRGMHAALLAVAIEKQAPLYAALFQQGCEEGLFHTDTPLETAEFLLTAAQFLTDQGIYPWSAEPLARRSKALPALFETQLKAQPGSFQYVFSQLSEKGELK